MDLTKKTKKELLALCEEHELETDGTKADLMERLQAHIDEMHPDGDLSHDEEVVEEEIAEDPVEEVVEEVVEETPAPAAEMPKTSARERVRIAWRLTQGGGHPPAMLWEALTTDLALGRKTEAEIKAELADL